MALLDGVALAATELGRLGLLAATQTGERGANFLLDVFLADFFLGLVAASTATLVASTGLVAGLADVHLLDAHALPLAVFSGGFLFLDGQFDFAHDRRPRELLRLGSQHFGFGGLGGRHGFRLGFSRLRRFWGLRLGLFLFCSFYGWLLGLQGLQIHLAHHLGALLGIGGGFSRSFCFGGLGGRCSFFLGCRSRFLLGGRFRRRGRLGALHHRSSLALAELTQVNFWLLFLLLHLTLPSAGQRDALPLLNARGTALGLLPGFLVSLEVGLHKRIGLGVQLGVGLGLDLDAFGRQKINHSGHAKVEFTGDFAQAYGFG